MPTASAGTPVPPAQRKLTSAERYELVAQLRLSFHYQRIQWEVIRNGVALGAEEVQDQRLLAAETPPEANPALDVFVFVLMWAVEGPLAATIVGAVRQVIVNGLQRQLRLQSRAYRQLIVTELQARPGLDAARAIAATRTGKAARRVAAASGGGASRERRARDAVDRAQAAQKELQRLEAQRFGLLAQAREARPELRQAALALQGIRRPDLPDYLVAIPNIALQKSIAFPQTPPEAGVSPGVSLRASVDKRALELIQDSYLQQELYELKLNMLGEDITASDAADIFEDIGPQGPLDIAAVMDHYRVATAAIVWAQLLGTAEMRSRRAREQDARTRILQTFAGDPVGGGLPFTVPEQNQRYLVARFGDFAETWARRAPEEVLLPGPVNPRTQTPQAVEQYLQGGRGTAPEGILNAIIDMGLSTDPLILRLDLVLQWLGMLAEQAQEVLVLK